MLIMEITVYSPGQLTRTHAMVARMAGTRPRTSAPEVRSESLGEAAADSEAAFWSSVVVSEMQC